MRGLEHQWRVWRCAAVGLNGAQQIPRLSQHIRLEFEQIPTRVFYASVGSVSLRLSLLQRLGIDDVLGLMWIRQAARLEFVRKAKRLTILTSTGSSSDVSTLEQMRNQCS